MTHYTERTITMKRGVIVSDTSETRSGSLLDFLDDDTYHGDCSDSTSGIDQTPYTTIEYRSDSY